MQKSPQRWLNEMHLISSGGFFQMVVYSVNYGINELQLLLSQQLRQLVVYQLERHF